MNAINTLHRIAELLPEEEKQRFLLLSHKFINFSEDDELLLIIEAICLNTLLWKEVPEEISKILSGASPIPENHEQLKTMIDTAVREAVPSYQDLKSITKRLENHELALKKLSYPQPNNTHHRKGKTRWILTAFSVGFTLPYFLGALSKL